MTGNNSVGWSGRLYRPPLSLSWRLSLVLSCTSEWGYANLFLLVVGVSKHRKKKRRRRQTRQGIVQYSWDWGREGVLQTFDLTPDKISSRRMCVCLLVRERETLRAISSLRLHRNDDNCCLFSQDGRNFISGCASFCLSLLLINPFSFLLSVAFVLLFSPRVWINGLIELAKIRQPEQFRLMIYWFEWTTVEGGGRR